MAAVTMRTLDWIEVAPLHVEARAESSAAPAAVFAVLADHERWPEWFPSVREVTVLGPAEGVGARRRVAIPGASVEEEFIAWDPGVRWSFTAYDVKPRFTRSLVEDCRLEGLASGGTAIRYTMYLDPPPLLRPVVKRSTGRIRASIEQALANLSERAASTAA